MRLGKMGKFNRAGFRQLLPLAGRPLRVVEVGVYRGHSALWLLRYILTHPRSHYTGIDPWAPLGPGYIADPVAAELVARERLARFGSKATLIKSTSQLAFLRDDWVDGSIDFGHIDGSHLAINCACDSVNLWPLIKPGGILAWDDYVDKRKREPHHVKSIVDKFLQCITGQYEEVWRLRRHVGIRKLGGSKSA